MVCKNTYKYFYNAFGLCIASDFYFEELLSAENIDQNNLIDVIKGEIEVFNRADAPKGSVYTIIDGNFYCQQEGVCQYAVHNGSKIIVNPLNGHSINAFKNYILGTAISVLLLQRGNLPLHASALADGEQSYILAGKSGAGKSTLAAYMLSKGHQLIADDLSVVFSDIHNNSMVYLGIPQQKLWFDAVKEFFGSPDDFKRIAGLRDKYYIPVNNKYNSGKYLPIKAIIEIVKENECSVSMRELKGVEKFEAILKNICHYEFMKPLKVDKIQYKNCIALTKTLPVYRLIRPEGKFTVKEQFELLTKTVY